LGEGCLLLRGSEEMGIGKGKGKREWEVREERGRTTCIPHYFQALPQTHPLAAAGRLPPFLAIHH